MTPERVADPRPAAGGGGSAADGGWTSPVLVLLAAVAVAGTATALAGYAWSGWAEAPVAVRFAGGLIAFGLSPGVLIAGPLAVRHRHAIGPGDLLIAVFTASFSINLVFNLLLFVLGRSFADLTFWYVVLQTVGYLAWGAWVWRRGWRGGPWQVPPPPPRAIAVGGLVLACGAAVAAYIAYTHGAPPVNPEELVSLRKLAENPVVAYDNISFREGDPSTYLFVPFQVLIVGTSLLARLDVALTYSIFWGVTTVLSLAVLARLAWVIFGRAEVALVMTLAMVALAIFDPLSVVMEAGLVTPYPNRYGFGSGVLLPLCLLLFWSILRDPGVHLWRWALLAYLVVETTFVHARETLLAMGVMAAVLLLLVVRPRRHRATVLRIAGMMALTTAILFAYREVNLGLAPDLDSYVSGLSAATRGAMTRTVAEQGLWGGLVSEPPPRIEAPITDDFSVEVTVPGYRDLFVDSWQPRNEHYLGRLFLPLVVVGLPAYALFARSLAALSLALALAALGLITGSALVELSLAALVGNPEIFSAHNLILIAALLVLADAASRGGQAVARLVGGSAPARAVLAAAVVGVGASAFWLAESLSALRPVLAASWGQGFAWALIGATLLAIAVRLWRRDLPLFAGPEAAPSPASLAVSSALVAVLLLPAVHVSEVWTDNPLRTDYPPSAFTGDLVADHARLAASEKLPSTVYPVAVLRYLRDAVPPGQVLLASDTLELVALTPHYGAIVSVQGLADSTYVANADYLEAYAFEGEAYRLLPFIETEERRDVLEDLCNTLGVDLIVVGPDQSAQVRRVLAENPTLQALLVPLFDADEFLVLRVDPGPPA